MHKGQSQVREFHVMMGKQPTSPAEPAIRLGELRAKLILEEALETIEALVGSVSAYGLLRDATATLGQAAAKFADPKFGGDENLVEALDGVCDLLYVTYGCAEAIGVDIEPFFDEVHRSNMAKQGGAIREDGKYMKPPGWTAPDIAAVLERVRSGK